MKNIRKASKARPVADKVYSSILERIMDGRWQPGSLFDRRSVAKELGVSIAPVGEAMVRLEEDGFVVNLPRKGTMLRPCDPRKLYESMILREAVECEAAYLAFGRLKASERTLRKLAKEADSELGIAADSEFHRQLVSSAGVEKLSEQFERLLRQMLFDELSLLDAVKQIGDAHAKLLDELLSAQSASAAAERMRKHLRKSRESLFARFEIKN